jgi:hypothetical protein
MQARQRRWSYGGKDAGVCMKHRELTFDFIGEDGGEEPTTCLDPRARRVLSPRLIVGRAHATSGHPPE